VASPIPVLSLVVVIITVATLVLSVTIVPISTIISILRLGCNPCRGRYAENKSERQNSAANCGSQISHGVHSPFREKKGNPYAVTLPT